eukprot:g12040.t1
MPGATSDVPAGGEALCFAEEQLGVASASAAQEGCGGVSFVSEELAPGFAAYRQYREAWPNGPAVPLGSMAFHGGWRVKLLTKKGGKGEQQHDAKAPTKEHSESACTSAPDLEEPVLAEAEEQKAVERPERKEAAPPVQPLDGAEATMEGSARGGSSVLQSVSPLPVLPRSGDSLPDVSKKGDEQAGTPSQREQRLSTVSTEFPPSEGGGNAAAHVEEEEEPRFGRGGRGRATMRTAAAAHVEEEERDSDGAAEGEASSSEASDCFVLHSVPGDQFLIDLEATTCQSRFGEAAASASDQGEGMEVRRPVAKHCLYGRKKNSVLPTGPLVSAAEAEEFGLPHRYFAKLPRETLNECFGVEVDSSSADEAECEGDDESEEEHAVRHTIWHGSSRRRPGKRTLRKEA